MKRSLCYRFKIKTFAVAMTLAATGLTSCQDDELVGQPSWLNNSIYGYLQEQGNYGCLTRLINDLDMTDVLNMTGSKTIFAADDAAFRVVHAQFNFVRSAIFVVFPLMLLERSLHF